MNPMGIAYLSQYANNCILDKGRQNSLVVASLRYSLAHHPCLGTIAWRYLCGCSESVCDAPLAACRIFVS